MPLSRETAQSLELTNAIIEQSLQCTVSGADIIVSLLYIQVCQLQEAYT